VTGAIYDRAEALSRIGDDEALFQTLVEMFLADAPGYLQEIDTAWAKSDLEHLHRAAHTLKGVLATFSAHAGQQVAQGLEFAAKGADLAAIPELILRLREETQRFSAALAG
jgi:HPt (histidine-containing phosphotransfer) domain-containing protein